jgi:threonyl-tRNA synthetase
MAVIGDKEIEEGSLSLRKYGEQKTESYSVADCLNLFTQLDGEKIRTI